MKIREFFGAVSNFLRIPTYSRTLAILGVVVILIAIPVTVIFLGQQTNLFQHAAEIGGGGTTCINYTNAAAVCSGNQACDVTGNTCSSYTTKTNCRYISGKCGYPHCGTSGASCIRTSQCTQTNDLTPARTSSDVCQSGTICCKPYTPPTPAKITYKCVGTNNATNIAPGGNKYNVYSSTTTGAISSSFCASNEYCDASVGANTAKGIATSPSQICKPRTLTYTCTKYTTKTSTPLLGLTTPNNGFSPSYNGNSYCSSSEFCDTTKNGGTTPPCTSNSQLSQKIGGINVPSNTNRCGAGKVGYCAYAESNPQNTGYYQTFNPDGACTLFCQKSVPPCSTIDSHYTDISYVKQDCTQVPGQDSRCCAPTTFGTTGAQTPPSIPTDGDTCSGIVSSGVTAKGICYYPAIFTAQAFSHRWSPVMVSACSPFLDAGTGLFLDAIGTCPNIQPISCKEMLQQDLNYTGTTYEITNSTGCRQSLGVNIKCCFLSGGNSTVNQQKATSQPTSPSCEKVYGTAACQTSCGTNTKQDITYACAKGSNYKCCASTCDPTKQSCTTTTGTGGNTSGGGTSAPAAPSCTNGQNTAFIATLKLEGIGTGNLENNTPAHPNRQALFVKVTDEKNNILFNNTSMTFVYSNADGKFTTGNVNMGTKFSCGHTYTLTIKIPHYLPATATVAYGKSQTLTLTPIAGDINLINPNGVVIGDNKIDVNDYNLFRDSACGRNVDPNKTIQFTSNTTTVNVKCSDLINLLDYTDGGTQGNEWSFNYNEWARGFFKANGY